MDVSWIVAGIIMVPVGILLAGFVYGTYLQYVKGEDVINESE